MQLDVAQQVPLLGEGSSTLVTLERPLTYEHMDKWTQDLMTLKVVFCL